MNKFDLTFHHFGLAVKKPDQAIKFHRDLGYHIGETVFDPLQNVNLLMCDHSEMPDVEIIYPAEGKSPVEGLLRRHSDGLVYHLCYLSDNAAASVAAIGMDLQVLCVSEPKPAVLFGGKKVSFYIVAGMGLIEIIDEGL